MRQAKATYHELSGEWASRELEYSPRQLHPEGYRATDRAELSQLEEEPSGMNDRINIGDWCTLYHADAAVTKAWERKMMSDWLVVLVVVGLW